MSQMLLPLANLASEIMTNMKGRLRAVVVVNSAASGQDDGENSLFAGTIGLRWHDVPYMRELLRVRSFVFIIIIRLLTSRSKLIAIHRHRD